jgi:hypothetical protein
MLKAVVIVLGALIVIALGVLVAGLVSRFGGHGPARGASAEAFALPRDARVVGMESQPNRLILHVLSPAGEEVDIIDTGDGHLIARLKARK